MNKNEVATFTDHYGKKGTIGAKVYHWHHDIGEQNEARKAEMTRTVERIFKWGKAGTQLILSGERGSVTAKNYVIVQ